MYVKTTLHSTPASFLFLFSKFYLYLSHYFKNIKENVLNNEHLPIITAFLHNSFHFSHSFPVFRNVGNFLKNSNHFSKGKKARSKRTHVSSAHVTLVVLSHMVTPNFKGSREMYSYVWLGEEPEMCGAQQ